jgi:hypothetical protein
MSDNILKMGPVDFFSGEQVNSIAITNTMIADTGEISEISDLSK